MITYTSFLSWRRKKSSLGLFFISFHFIFIITKICFKTLSYIKRIVFIYFENEWGFGKMFVSKITHINKNTLLFYGIMGKQTSACNIFLIRYAHAGIFLLLHCEIQCADLKPSLINVYKPNALVMLVELFNKVVGNLVVMWGSMTWGDMLTDRGGQSQQFLISDQWMLMVHRSLAQDGGTDIWLSLFSANKQHCK